jgi:hypothetical protein
MDFAQFLEYSIRFFIEHDPDYLSLYPVLAHNEYMITSS